MKLKKITKSRKTERKRWYDDACGTAFALELIGERWAILIMRELMFGPRRFGELRRDLPRISANILTQRLNQLEENRILRRRSLPPPASVQVYELTDWGYEAEELVQILGRWATRHPDHDPTLPLSAASIMMSFRTMFDAERAGDINARVGFRLGNDGFVVHIHERRVDTARTEPDDVDVLFEGKPTGLAAAVYDGETFADLAKAGFLLVTGDRGLANTFTTLFPLPDKLPEGSA